MVKVAKFCHILFFKAKLQTLPVISQGYLNFKDFFLQIQQKKIVDTVVHSRIAIL